MMSEHKPGAGMRFWKKLTSALGMTMAEVLIVVAIVAVLAGLGVVGVWNYQRSLGQLERDGIAKEIFIAAQNHLTAMKGEGYLDNGVYGTNSTSFEKGGKKDVDMNVWYFTVTNGTTSADANDIFLQMLPFGSVDETLRMGGSYLIRYQPETATVLDVFYCNPTPGRFGHNLTVGEYETVMGNTLYGDTRAAKMARRNWGGAILGWYGGADPSTLPSITLKAPTIEVNNGDTLTVTVTDNTENSTYTGRYSLKLIITGELSGAQKGVLLFTDGSESPYSTADGRLTDYTFTLDDITKENLHFSQMSSDTKDDLGNEIPFIPGENLRIQAVAYSSTNIANIAYSDIKTTNSLYADGTTANTAYISNIRHLENLDKAISHMDDNDSNDKLDITAAKQIEDLSWTSFWSNGVYYDSAYDPSADPTPTPVYEKTDNCFYPIEPDYSVTYDGQSHSITGVTAKGENAGLFGSTTQVSEIKNLELIDFSVNGTATAGALAGTLNGCTVTNVLARNTDASATSLSKIITAPTAGGLIGSIGNSTVQYSAASVIVSGASYAGGLIGSAESTQITGCYSGGHTKDGSYLAWINDGHSYDVTGGTVGGLIGSYTGYTAGDPSVPVDFPRITSSYSTCSVSGTTAGGFAGSVRGTINKSYSTGLVSSTGTGNDKVEHAFVGINTTMDLSDNHYFMTINTETKNDENVLMDPVKDYSITSNMAATKPLDLNAAAYNSFTGAYDTWNHAEPYDGQLENYYTSRYTLKTVDELGSTPPTGYSSWDDLFVSTHYGDWPSPELFFVNNS